MPRPFSRRESRHFNPRSRVGSDLIAYDEHQDEIDFNPRSRVGSDVGYCCGRCGCMISIHAPVWGATEIKKFPQSFI